jgi:hypothetical protein
MKFSLISWPETKSHAGKAITESRNELAIVRGRIAMESYVVGTVNKKAPRFSHGALSVNHPRKKSNAMLGDS